MAVCKLTSRAILLGTRSSHFRRKIGDDPDHQPHVTLTDFPDSAAGAFSSGWGPLSPRRRILVGWGLRPPGPVYCTGQRVACKCAGSCSWISGCASARKRAASLPRACDNARRCAAALLTAQSALQPPTQPVSRRLLQYVVQHAGKTSTSSEDRNRWIMWPKLVQMLPDSQPASKATKFYRAASRATTRLRRSSA